MAAAILFVGDMHLGRRPASLPEDLADHEIAPAELTPAAAWRRVVARAIEMRVDAVVLGGDVVESENARFEAFGPLHEGVLRLVRSGIAVFAVAGNHDVEALPRLSRSIPEFHLLGRCGAWETVPLLQAGRPVARLLGWSFPAPRHTASPLEQSDFPSRKPDDLPLLGVVHGDLTSATSPYAPLRREDLERGAPDAWFLGHVHKPGPFAGPRPIGYLGSLTGLDPTETGAHGPWLVRLEAGRPPAVEQLPLAPLAWETMEIDVEACGDPPSIEAAVRPAVEALHARILSRGGQERAVGCRLELRGRTPHRAHLARARVREDWTALRLRLDGVLYFVASVADATRSTLDTAELAAGDDPAALLAARLAGLERGDPSSLAILRRARHVLEPVAAERAFGFLDPAALDDERLRELLIEAGMRALEVLLEQRGERPR